MKKRLYYSMSLVLGLAMVFSSCKKSNDPTPDVDPDAKVFTTVMTGTNGGSTGSAIVVGNVTTSDNLVKLRLEVNHTGSNNLSKIFIMKSVDNGALQPLSYSGNITNGDGKTFTGSSSNHTFDVPGSTKSFILDIPVSVRTTSAAVTDVYHIWLTDGAGAFTKPTKNRVLGIATVTLKYTSAAPSLTFATATVDLGSQSSNDYGSLLVTSGQVSALNTADYNDSPNSADIRFCTLTGGKKDNNSTELWLYSPANIGSANPAVGGQADFDETPVSSSRTTYLALYGGATAFDDVTGATLDGLSVGTATSVQVSAGNVYMFQTSTGKKGLIKVNSSASTANYVGTGSTTAKNMNVTVKVLN